MRAPVDAGYSIRIVVGILVARSSAMVAHLTPQLETRIAKLVSSGNYADADEVIEKAVSLLEERSPGCGQSSRSGRSRSDAARSPS
jgi:Arc/MetJ-type ribon-helix-helix transcriptional regulator